MTKTISKGFVLVAGLLAAGGIADSDPRPTEKDHRCDPRQARIQQFFKERDCPAQKLAADFVAAADMNRIDWRLLPSLSLVESTGGKYQKNNNMFGWENSNFRFRNNKEGVYYVASALRHAQPYRDKNLDGVLRSYNPDAAYPARVKAVMEQLGPAPGK
jgi:hypothetical protein